MDDAEYRKAGYRDAPRRFHWNYARSLDGVQRERAVQLLARLFLLPVPRLLLTRRFRRACEHTFLYTQPAYARQLQSAPQCPPATAGSGTLMPADRRLKCQ